MTNQNFDLVVIGAGPGGYVAAIRAAQLGFKTAVIEKEHLGGICLNWGCIPTKALLRSSDIFRSMQHASSFGLKADNIDFDLKAIVKRSRGVASQLSAGVAHLMKKNKITVINGHGKLNGKGKIVVDDNGKQVNVTAEHIILATGARAKYFPGLEPDGKLIWTYKHALAADVMPKKLLVIGSGAIGIEFASFFNTLGSDTTVVEVMDRVVPAEDAEISAVAQKSFEKQGMKIKTKTKVSKLDKKANSVIAHFEDDKGNKSSDEFDRVILAVGVVPNTEDIGLQTTNVKTDKRGVVQVNEWLQTDEQGVYAIGDITEGPWLAHKASHEAIICVEKIKGLKDVHPLNKDQIPGCTYCHPQIASVGITEEQAKSKNLNVKVGRFPFIANGKAIALGETEGMVKTIFDSKTGELLGVHMIGAEVTEMIQGLGIAMNLETTEAELMHTVFPHPTISETIHESVLDAFDRVIHI